MTKEFWQLRRETLSSRAFSAIMISLSVLALAGTAIAQEKPPVTYPPALPATSRTGSFGPTLTAPGITPSFPAPNTTTWTALGPKLPIETTGDVPTGPPGDFPYRKFWADVNSARDNPVFPRSEHHYLDRPWPKTPDRNHR